MQPQPQPILQVAQVSFSKANINKKKNSQYLSMECIISNDTRLEWARQNFLQECSTATELKFKERELLFFGLRELRLFFLFLRLV